MPNKMADPQLPYRNMNIERMISPKRSFLGSNFIRLISFIDKVINLKIGETRWLN